MKSRETPDKNSRGCTPQLIAILVIAIFILLLLKFGFSGLPENPTLPSIFPSPTPSPTMAPRKVGLSINPSIATASANQNFSLSVLADTRGIDVTVLDINIVFDSEKISLNAATPAAFFKEQSVFVNQTDEDRGTIRLAIGSLIPASGSGILTRLEGTVKPAASGSAYVQFSSSTKVGSVGTTDSVLGKMEGTEIDIR